MFVVARAGLSHVGHTRSRAHEDKYSQQAKGIPNLPTFATMSMQHVGPPNKAASPTYTQFLSTMPSQSPEPFSINSILRQWNRERLYVKPIQWVQRHLQYLDCHFTQVKPTDRQQRRRPVELSTKEIIRRANILLRKSSEPSFKNASVESLLREHNIPRYR